MIIVYTPEGGEPERLDAGRLRASEIQIAERTADRPWDVLKAGLLNADVTSVRTLAWVIKKRADTSLRFSAFDPFEDELRVRLDARETHGYAREMFERYGHDPAELDGAWAELREAADDPAVADAAIKELEDGPKAGPDSSGSETSETSTSASSLSTSDGPPTKSTA
ncbi:hypothetical protein ACIQ1S_03140 [Streptomyces griseus]|uniref:hypothetical protein n=1 Tax=Streptomyces griseus TaxID=1911 RepID=UPI00382E9D44